LSNVCTHTGKWNQSSAYTRVVCRGVPDTSFWNTATASARTG